MAKTKRTQDKSKKNTRTKSRREKKMKVFYPGKLIGTGGSKFVFSVTSVMPINIVDDILIKKEREAMSIVLDESLRNSVVLVKPQREMTKKERNNFVGEMKLQEKFSELGLAPKVLEVNGEMKSGNDYTPYAYTYRCYFNLCDYDFAQISADLKKLFDGVADAGYIYTDIKQANMCEFNVLRKKKIKSKHFVFVDFDDDFIYPYKGFEPGAKLGNNDLKEIVSDIMEFMFIVIELHRCGKAVNCNFCDNSYNMSKRVAMLLAKYAVNLKTHPMISETGPSLLTLTGASIPLLRPQEMVNYYIQDTVIRKGQQSKVLYDSVINLLRNEELKNNLKTQKKAP